MIGDACCGHEISFVGGVEEDFSLIIFACESGDGGDEGAVFFDPICAIKPLLAVDGDVVFANEGFEGLFRDVWFEDPHGVAIFAIFGVVGSFLMSPSSGLIVVFFEALIEFAREA